MAQRGKLKRYLLLLDKLTREPSMGDLLDLMDNQGFNVSKRTIQRDLEDLRDEFGVEVQYDRANNVYRITGDQSERDTLKQMLERAQLLELVQASGNNLTELRQYLHFEDLGRLSGLEHIGPLLKAIRSRNEVKVSYQKFGEPEPAPYRFKPHRLKEFRGRWYLLGLSTKYEHPIALGLDRIRKVERMKKRFTRHAYQIDSFYDHVIGVDTRPGEPERVVLHFKPSQAPYVLALPLHWSQVVKEEDARGTTVVLNVMPNIELQQILLGLGDSVKVLEPEHLALSIKKMHIQAAARYG